MTVELVWALLDVASEEEATIGAAELLEEAPSEDADKVAESDEDTLEVLDDKSEALDRVDDEGTIMLEISELLAGAADGTVEAIMLSDSVEDEGEIEEEIEETTDEVAANELLDATSEALEVSDDEEVTELDMSKLLGVKVIIAVDESLDIKEIEEAEVLVGRVNEEEENGGIELLENVAGSDELEVVETLEELEEVSDVVWSALEKVLNDRPLDDVDEESSSVDILELAVCRFVLPGTTTVPIEPDPEGCSVYGVVNDPPVIVVYETLCELDVGGAEIEDG